MSACRGGRRIKGAEQNSAVANDKEEKIKLRRCLFFLLTVLDRSGWTAVTRCIPIDSQAAIIKIVEQAT